MARVSFLLLLFVALGCVSAIEGRWEAAADLYIDALKRDSELPGARERLRVCGDRAIEAHLKLAGELEAAGRWDGAAQEYERTDSLVDRAAAVRVSLATPSDYQKRRRVVFDRVIDDALADAEAMAAQGRYVDAAAAFRKAVARYGPSDAQRERAKAGRYAALVSGARKELDAGRYEQAHSLVDRALAIYGADSSRAQSAVALKPQIDAARFQGLLADAQEQMDSGRFQDAYSLVLRALEIYGEEAEASTDALALRAKVIEAGTVDVVALPVWRTERAARGLPPGLLDDVNDIFDERHWASPPLFVATMDSKSVRGELRRLDFDRAVLTDRQARTVAEQLKADFVVVPFVRKVAWDVGEEPQPRPVGTRDGKGTTIDVYKQRNLIVGCAFRIIRVADGEVILEGAVRAEAQRKYRHAAYDGDRRQLLLSQEEHRWFDRRRRTEVDRELVKEISSSLAEGLATTILEEVTKHLP
ncbi:MAG: hypothetical protein ACYTGZ_16915 [Planctomycetota bacterium]|jgi:tetratricopeptide (TPR) repeat protein